MMVELNKEKTMENLNNLEMNHILDSLYSQRNKIEKANSKFDGEFQKELDFNMKLIKKVYAHLINETE